MGILLEPMQLLIAEPQNQAHLRADFEFPPFALTFVHPRFRPTQLKLLLCLDSTSPWLHVCQHRLCLQKLRR
jgi:hypothetical protein